MIVNTAVKMLEPNWYLVVFTSEKPPANERPHWLHQTLSDWLKKRPGREVRRVQPIQDGGALVALMVWLGENPIVRIHPDLSLAKEYLEMVLEVAASVYSQAAPKGPVAVINHAGIAVVVTNQILVMPMRELNLPPEALAEVQEWQKHGSTNAYIVPVPGVRAID